MRFTGDVVDNLKHIAEQGAYVHLMDWKTIVSNADRAAGEIERLRRERDDLVSFLAGVGRQTSEMAKSYTDKSST